MRILVLSNLYPPYYLGGYELACKDVVDRLEARGHELFVLTSMYGISRKTICEKVYKILHLHRYGEPLISIRRFAWNQFRNRQYIAHMVRVLTPDIVYIWGMSRLELSLPRTLAVWSENHLRRPHKIPTVFAVSDRWLLGEDGEYQHWMEYWDHIPKNPVKQVIKPIVKRIVSHFLPITELTLHIQYAHFFSRTLHQQHVQAGLIPENYRIIYHGVLVEKSSVPQTDSANSAIPKKEASFPEPSKQQPDVRLLYCGRVEELKGVHTAIEAIAILIHQKKIKNIHLTIIGPQPYEVYLAQLHSLIEQYRLQHIISIHDKISRHQLECVYNSHDFLLFPSIWEEPFSITILEAMAHKLAVIATPTGGSTEILRHAENCMIFPAGDAYELANQVELLLRTPELVTRIRANAYQMVQAHYSLEKVVERIEEYLTEIIHEYSTK